MVWIEEENISLYRAKFIDFFVVIQPGLVFIITMFWTMLFVANNELDTLSIKSTTLA